METAFSELMPVALFSKEFLKKAKTGSIPDEMIEKMETALEEADLDYHKEEIPLAIQQSLDGADRVAKIVQSMKEFSHPGGEEIETDINQGLDNTITISRNEWKYVATIHRDFDESLPKVLCHPGEINQVFLNMVINAANAIEETLDGNKKTKGKIYVKTQKINNMVQIRIRDNGAGILKENQTRIFDPFFTTKQVGKGSGQGLSIAYAIIAEKHKGKIEFESEAGKGTTFIISLPIGKE